jgi:hypothetical protein
VLADAVGVWPLTVGVGFGATGSGE